VRAELGDVLRFEDLAEALPRHGRRFLVQAVVDFVLQVAPPAFGLQGVAGPGALALALAGDRVMPLEHVIGPVGEALHPDGDVFVGHG
jgi:hypothetical protein